MQETRDIKEEADDSTKDFWKAIEKYKEKFNALTDKEIKETYSDSKAYYTYTRYVIPAYSSTSAQQTIWNGYCVPSAISFVYRNSISKNFNGVQLPDRDDNNFKIGEKRIIEKTGNKTGNIVNIGIYNVTPSLDGNIIQEISNVIDGGMYYKLMTTGYVNYKFKFLFWHFEDNRKGALYDRGNVYSSGFDDLMRAVTNGTYTIKPCSESTMANRIQSDYPAFITIPRHMVVGIGYKSKTKHWSVKYTRYFLWFVIDSWIKNKTSTTYDFYITDNGYITGFNPADWLKRGDIRPFMAGMGRSNFNMTPFWASLGSIFARGSYSLYKF